MVFEKGRVVNPASGGNMRQHTSKQHGSKNEASQWEQVTLCLCGKCSLLETRLARAGLGLRLRLGSERSQAKASDLVAGFIDLGGGTNSLPLQQVCLAARDRRQQAMQENGQEQAQVLVLFDRGFSRSPELREVNAALQQDPKAAEAGLKGSEPPDASQAEVSFWMHGLASACRGSFFSFVEICSLKSLGHPDLLYALAIGYSRVWVQHADPGSAAVQDQELALVAALGGQDRVKLFSHLEDIQNDVQDPPDVQFQIMADISDSSSRWEIVNRCAQALLPTKQGRVPLPEKSPYGGLSLASEGCDFCEACAWVCPTEAITITADGCMLNFTEANCVQCGLCISVCHRRALNLRPSMVLNRDSKTAKDPAVLLHSKFEIGRGVTAGRR